MRLFISALQKIRKSLLFFWLSPSCNMDLHSVIKNIPVMIFKCCVLLTLEGMLVDVLWLLIVVICGCCLEVTINFCFILVSRRTSRASIKFGYFQDQFTICYAEVPSRGWWEDDHLQVDRWGAGESYFSSSLSDHYPPTITLAWSCTSSVLPWWVFTCK